jgi:hypothetical protein
VRKLHSNENEVRRVEYFILSISLYEIQYFASPSADSILTDPLLDRLESLSHKHPRLPPTFIETRDRTVPPAVCLIISSD